MFSSDALDELLRHMEWADAKVWAAVPQQNPADARLMQWLVHVHVVQRAFYTLWTGGDVASVFRTPADFASPREVRSWAQPYYPAAREFIRGLNSDRLHEALELPWAAQLAQQLGRPIGSTTIGETCFQVTSHSTYHRGQINARLREIGAEPPLVDYIAWLWFGRPDAEWMA